MTPVIVHSAHLPGLNTCLAFSHDGLAIHTGGEDGLVRKWPLDLGGGKEPEPADEADEAITSLAASRKCWLSASLDSCVRTYNVHGTTMEGFVTRAMAVPVRCITIDQKGHRVAVASDELEVKIIDLSDIANIKKLVGHRKGVRKVTWHPSGSLLTSCGSEGNIIVWDVTSGEEQTPVETITGILPVAEIESPEFAHDCSAVWHPSGKYFVVASRTHDIVAISRDTWEIAFKFSDDDVAGETTALAISPNGTYLASASKSGIFIWSTATREILFRHIFSPTPSLVLQLAFSPTQNLLAWTDADGNLFRWPDPIPDTSPDPVTANSAFSVPHKGKNDPLTLDNDTEDANKYMTSILDDDYGNDDDWMIDDIGLKNDKEENLGESGYAKEMVSVTKAQPAFQPASTPMADKKRYLAFNMIGVIEVTDQDTHNIVNVEFHDRSTRAGTHFQDTLKYDIASLGEHGALYACPPEGGRPAQITYKPFSGWSTSGEWHYSLPPSEKVIALAAGGSPPPKSLRDRPSESNLEGNGNVVVATSHGYLRFLSGGGIQRYLWALGTDVVSMVASREFVFVVHRDGGTSLDGCQNLSYFLIAWDTFDLIQRGQLPLPRGTVLRWIGISEEGAPAMYDSNGLLSILDRFRRPGQGRWVTILDTATLARRKGKDESYWPVGVSGKLFMCLILKGRDDYPGFPRPLIQELDVQVPLLGLDVPHGPMEERILRETLHIGMLKDSLSSDLTNEEISLREFTLDKELIQLIQLACKDDKLQRALDVATLLHNSQSFDMAAKVAQFYHLIGLQEKLNALKSERDNSDRLEEEKARRRKWSRESAPIPAPQTSTHALQNRREVEEFSRRPATVGKLLAPAVPIADSESKSHGSAASRATYVQPSYTDLGSSDNSFDANISTFQSDILISSGDQGKRKRDEPNTVEVDFSERNKKRALSVATVSDTTVGTFLKAKTNPFAKKSQDSKNNPFAKPAGSTANVGTKSNSFFDKVDEANGLVQQVKATARKSKGKEKEKTDNTLQTTLFGLPPGPVAKKRGAGRPPKDESRANGPTKTSTPILLELNCSSAPEANDIALKNDSQTDVAIADVSPSTPPSFAEQASSDGSVADKVVGSPEPEIDWPPSPPHNGMTISTEVAVS